MAFLGQASGIEQDPKLCSLSFECGATHRLGITLDAHVRLLVTPEESEVQRMTPMELHAHCQARVQCLLQHKDLKTLVDRTSLDISVHTDTAEEYFIPPEAREGVCSSLGAVDLRAHYKALHQALLALQLQTS